MDAHPRPAPRARARGRPRAVAARDELLDLLERNSMPHGFYAAESEAAAS